MTHDHDHQPQSYNRRFAIGVALNVVFVGVEAVYGLLAGSLALLADAGHNLSDVAGLLLAWGAAWLAGKAPTPHRTYGFQRGTILASLLSALMLLLAMGVIAWEAIARLSDPGTVNGGVMMVVAGIGVVINTATALLFMSGRKDDLNIRGAFLHMAADAGVSAGVVVSGLLISAGGWLWLDPAISLVIVVVVVWSTVGLLRESGHLVMDGVPSHVDPREVRAWLNERPGVEAVHDLHVWALGTTKTALTAHLVMPGGHPGDTFLGDLNRQLGERFSIQHATLQIEVDREVACPRDSGHP